MRCLFAYSELPFLTIYPMNSSKTHVRGSHTVTLQLKSLWFTQMQWNCRITLTHLLLLTQSPRGVLVQTTPKTASMLIKIAPWPALWWKSELLRSHICLAGAHSNDGPWRVGLKTFICPPSVVPITVMPPTGDTVKTTRTTFSRTHMYLMTLCVIFGAQPSYRQITSSSVSLAWMCSQELACDDALLHDCWIIQVQWVKGKHQIEDRIYRAQKKERCIKKADLANSRG